MRSKSWILILILLHTICGQTNVPGNKMYDPYWGMAMGGENGNKRSRMNEAPQSYMNGSLYGMTNSNMNGPYDMSGMSSMGGMPGMGGMSNMMMMMYGMQMIDPEMLKFMQPITVGRDRKYDDLKNNDGYLCTRDCCEHPEPRLCYFQFTAEEYNAMGPACGNCTFGNLTDCMQEQCITCDGIERTVFSIDRMIPSPLIRVCKGDRLVIDISNSMLSSALAIHWHGILQKNTPWMDGVPLLTQCPIDPMGGMFRYDFTVDDAGTYFYHSHEGKLQSNGILGGLVVDECDDPNRCFYDCDYSSHVLVISDWDHFLAESFYPGYWYNTSYTSNMPSSYLINGRGDYRDSVTKTTTPKYQLHVQSGGKRYRLRLICGTTAVCLIKFAIEDHTMKVIAADGYPCKPKDFNTLVMGPGVRYDVVITSKKKHTSTCSYNIIVTGMQQCANVTYPQRAYLVYDDCNPEPSSKPNFTSLTNTPPYLDNVALNCSRDDNTCAYELESTEPAEEDILCGKPVHQRFFLHVGFHLYNYTEEFKDKMMPYKIFEVPGGAPFYACDTINGVLSMMPWFPILYQDDPIKKDMICPGKCNNNESFCVCINMIHCDKDSIIEFVLLDEMGTSGVDEAHPMHIHGHNWRICYQGSMEERMADGKNYYLKRTNSKCPAKRDMCVIPNGGWAVVRFKADNPGYWMFHCHFENHLVTGMFLTIEVGFRFEMKQPPPDFPRCSAYLPRITNLKDYESGGCHCSNPKCSKKSCSCQSKTNKTTCNTQAPMQMQTENQSQQQQAQQSQRQVQEQRKAYKGRPF